MNDIKVRIEEMLKELKQERDELHVNLHLAKMETGEEIRDGFKKITRHF